MTVNGRKHEGILIILEKYWEVTEDKSLIITCPCCKSKNGWHRKTHEIIEHALDAEGSVTISLKCGCIEEQDLCLDNYETSLQEGTN